MSNVVLVGIGGFLGACSRYLSGRLINRHWKGSFPLATFIVNVVGSFLLGLVISQPELYQTMAREVDYFLVIGFLGAFTTFSTFELEVLQLVEKRKYKITVSYVVLSFLIGFILAWVTGFVARC